PEPEPEPDPEEPPPEIPPPKQKPRKVKQAPISKQPVSDEPPPPPRFDQSQVVQDGNSGVSVNTGEPGDGVPGGTGKPNSKGTGSRPPGVKTDKQGEPWAPTGELHIKTLPRVIKVKELQCPAVRELGIEGTVVLKVQVRKTGDVRDVSVVKGIGHGCDKVAAKALRGSRFKPAIATNGKPADYELRYEYEFQLED
ncbi:MAG: TonB family protein, partial [Myxococcales bacterium]|nr:TonB family protein [Myxococcales bacterium]